MAFNVKKENHADALYEKFAGTSTGWWTPRGRAWGLVTSQEPTRGALNAVAVTAQAALGPRSPSSPSFHILSPSKGD